MVGDPVADACNDPFRGRAGEGVSPFSLAAWKRGAPRRRCTPSGPGASLAPVSAWLRPQALSDPIRFSGMRSPPPSTRGSSPAARAGSPTAPPRVPRLRRDPVRQGPAPGPPPGPTPNDPSRTPRGSVGPRPRDPQDGKHLDDRDVQRVAAPDEDMVLTDVQDVVPVADLRHRPCRSIRSEHEPSRRFQASAEPDASGGARPGLGIPSPALPFVGRERALQLEVLGPLEEPPVRIVASDLGTGAHRHMAAVGGQGHPGRLDDGELPHRCPSPRSWFPTPGGTWWKAPASSSASSGPGIRGRTALGRDCRGTCAPP
jgi:hypothetical protein